jgi:thiol-disulfide isomerase/thioredoxin
VAALPKRKWREFLLVAAFAVAGFSFLAYSWREAGIALVTGQQEITPEALFQSRFEDLDGNLHSFSEWHGKVLVVNFWATWCHPCRLEIPEFIQLQNKYRGQGLVFVGLALDQKDKVRQFVGELAVNYPILLGDLGGMELARKMGNGIGNLPYTVVFDRNGNLVATKLGATTGTQMETLIKPLL